jgi:DNA-binding XRE family transcriptional regulator
VRIAVCYDGCWYQNAARFFVRTRGAQLSLPGLHDAFRWRAAGLFGCAVQRVTVTQAHYVAGRDSGASPSGWDQVLADHAIIRHDVPVTAGKGEVGADVEFALTCYQIACEASPDLIVLVAGDGDFAPLAARLVGRGLRVLVPRANFSYPVGAATVTVTTSALLTRRATDTPALADLLDAAMGPDYPRFLSRPLVQVAGPGPVAPSGQVAPAGQGGPAGLVAPAGQGGPAGLVAPAGQGGPSGLVGPAGHGGLGGPSGLVAPAGRGGLAAPAARYQGTVSRWSPGARYGFITSGRLTWYASSTETPGHAALAPGTQVTFTGHATSPPGKLYPRACAILPRPADTTTSPQAPVPPASSATATPDPDPDPDPDRDPEPDPTPDIDVGAALGRPWLTVVDSAALTSCREKLGWSRGELARQSGVSVTTITRLEKADSNGHIRTISRVAAALGQPISALTPGRGDTNEINAAPTAIAKNIPMNGMV